MSWHCTCCLSYCKWVGQIIGSHKQAVIGRLSGTLEQDFSLKYLIICFKNKSPTGFKLINSSIHMFVKYLYTLHCLSRTCICVYQRASNLRFQDRILLLACFDFPHELKTWVNLVYIKTMTRRRKNSLCGRQKGPSMMTRYARSYPLQKGPSLEDSVE